MELFIIGFGEIFRKDKDEVIEYGDIVCIGKDGLAHKVSTDKDLETIIGICSDTIGVEMGGDAKDLPEEEKLEVEMLGKIWVKSTDTSIEQGDIVEAVKDGTVIKATDVTKKFGIALTNNVNGKVRIVYNG